VRGTVCARYAFEDFGVIVTAHGLALICRFLGTTSDAHQEHVFIDLRLALIFAAFIYHPEWIKAWLRFMTAFIETIADQLPEPWASRVEVALRELGGIIWIQMATVPFLAPLERTGHQNNSALSFTGRWT
jgi:hypothetical protein